MDLRDILKIDDEKAYIIATDSKFTTRVKACKTGYAVKTLLEYQSDSAPEAEAAHYQAFDIYKKKVENDPKYGKDTDLSNLSDNDLSCMMDDINENGKRLMLLCSTLSMKKVIELMEKDLIKVKVITKEVSRRSGGSVTAKKFLYVLDSMQETIRRMKRL